MDAVKSKFGFEINQGRHIDMDRIDTRLADEISAHVRSWKACLNCGSCSATCPGGVGLRSLLLKLSTLGELTTLDTCLLCGKCFLVCPRGISTRYLIIQIIKKRREYGKAV